MENAWCPVIGTTMFKMKNQWFYVVFRQRMIIGALTFATLDKNSQTEMIQDFETSQNLYVLQPAIQFKENILSNFLSRRFAFSLQKSSAPITSFCVERQNKSNARQEQWMLPLCAFPTRKYL